MKASLPNPEELQTTWCVIRPQRLDDNPADYAAVMANQAWLRRWSGSTWPEDGFSAADNLEDLRGHIEEHSRGEAFGFSVLSPDNSEVVGSLYVNDLDTLLDQYGAGAGTRGQLKGRHTRADLWTRLDRDPDLLAKVVCSAKDWFRHHWGISVVWCARTDCPELEQAYASAGLSLIARLVHPESGRIQLLFG